MKVTLALIAELFRETAAHRAFWAMPGFSTVVLLVLAALRVETGVPASVALLGFESSAGDIATLLANFLGLLAAFLVSAGLLVILGAAASVLPALFEPGRIEWLLAKPVSRPHLLLSRYAGSLLVIALNAAYLVGGVWLIAGLKTGIWPDGLLWSAAVSMVLVASLLAIGLLAAVLTASPVWSPVLTLAAVLGAAIASQRDLLNRVVEAAPLQVFGSSLYHVLPKVWDLGVQCRNLAMGQPLTDWSALATSAVSGVLALGGAVWLFQRRSY
ncbi:MAG: ABC transporter permease [Bryobacterales bacterium]|nr:ABC transporter permease [Bryobacterales bacterium]